MYAGMSGMLWLEFLRNHRKFHAPVVARMGGRLVVSCLVQWLCELLQEYCTTYRGGDWRSVGKCNRVFAGFPSSPVSGYSSTYMENKLPVNKLRVHPMYRVCTPGCTMPYPGCTKGYTRVYRNFSGVHFKQLLRSNVNAANRVAQWVL